LLAANPSLGRRSAWIRPGLHRFETGRHVLFYRREEDGIFIVRILHQSMIPEDQHFEDETQDG
jgi:toxin ParE1/3/4